jgi:para-nitrobenzyl esterase
MTTSLLRRRFVQASLVAAGAASCPSLVLAQGGRDIVETTNGRVRGVTIEGVRRFLGVPYGADTSGRNRFMAPRRAAPWPGVRDCTDWGHVAPQHIGPTHIDYTRYIGWTNFRGGMSEDCLVVNVWTPAARDHGKRPVMFVVHGGGFTSGSGNLEALDGQRLARLGDMVVVSVNHRLGMLGYFDLSAFGPGDLASSGNVGMMDLALALEWVRDNIAAFGGDPGNVTLAGQSGGGDKCLHLMATPSAKGLFHKVAVQSASTLKTGRHQQRQKEAEGLWTKLGVAKGDLARLQSIPFEQIVESQGNTGPVLDGAVVPRDPFDPDAPALSASVPMIIGSCLEEWSFTIDDTSNDEDSVRNWIGDQLRRSHAQGRAAEVLAAYRKAYPQKNGALLRAVIATDSSLRRSAVTMAERKAAQGAAPAFMYRWDWPAAGEGARWGAVHGTDLSPALANPTTAVTGDTPGGRLLASQLGSSFVAFARTGNPNNGAVPTWNAYEPSQRAVMIFGAQTHEVYDPNGDLRRLWDEILQG